MLPGENSTRPLNVVPSPCKQLNSSLVERRASLESWRSSFLNFLMLAGGDHVENRHALDLFLSELAEHLQVSRVGFDVHAFIDVGDGVGVNLGLVQGFTARLGLLQLLPKRLQLATYCEAVVLPACTNQVVKVLGILTVHHVPCAPGLSRVAFRLQRTLHLAGRSAEVRAMPL